MQKKINWADLVGSGYTASNGARATVTEDDIEDMQNCEDWPEGCLAIFCLFWNVCPKNQRRG